MAKTEMHFQSLDSLKHVQTILNEASEALKDPKRTIITSAISEVLGAALGAGAGAAISFAALYAGGAVAGLSAAGITSGLAAAGGLVGGGMAAGVFVLAAPVAILAVSGYAVFKSANSRKLRQEKERLYHEVLRKHDAIQRKLGMDLTASKERVAYLNALVILLSAALRDLKEDLQID